MEKSTLPLNIQLFAEGKEEEVKEPEQKGTGESKTPGKEEETKIPEKSVPPAEEQHATEEKTPPAPDSVLMRELLEARAQVAAVKEGILPAAIEDAVCLAVHAAEKAGETDTGNCNKGSGGRHEAPPGVEEGKQRQYRRRFPHWSRRQHARHSKRRTAKKNFWN